MVKNPPAMLETRVQSLGWEDPLEEGMATNSSIPAWRIPMDRGTCQATYGPWGHKESDMTEQLNTASTYSREWAMFIGTSPPPGLVLTKSVLNERETS